MTKSELTFRIGKLSTSYFDKITISFVFKSSNYEKGILLEKDIANRVKSFIPESWWVNSFEFRFLLPSLFLLIPSFIYLYLRLKIIFSGLKYEDLKKPKIELDFLEQILLMLIFLIPLFFLGSLLDVGKDFMFPKVFFSIGEQKIDYRKRIETRNLVLITIVLTFILTIFGNYLSSKLFS